MVADGAITEAKIDKTNMREWTDENGNKIFDVSKLYYGDDKFEVSYTETVNKVNALENKISSIELVGDQIFRQEKGVITPSSIKLEAKCRNGAIASHWYIDNIENTDYVSEDKQSITIPSIFMNDKKQIVVKVTNTDNTLYDIQTLYLISDVRGQGAISVIITSSNGTSFHANTTVSNTVCTCNVFEGITEITPKSYKWMMIRNDGNTWETVGTSKILTVNIDKSIIRTRLKCEVDIDI